MEFSVHICEYNRSNADYETIYRPEGSGDYLFLLFKTPMKVYDRTAFFIAQENACLFYTPDHEQHYQAVQKFRNSYVHFWCGKNLGETYGIPQNAVFYPQNTEAIDELIRLLQREYIVKDPYAVEYEEALVRQVMITASRGMRLYQKAAEEPAGLYQEFQELRLKMLSHYEKGWTTEKLCQMANMEKSQFYSYYKQFFSSTPHSDLIEVRLDKAKNLLTNQALSIGQTAEICGFSNLSHFSRYFKRHCGCSPREWQQQGGKSIKYKVKLQEDEKCYSFSQ